MEAVPSVTLRAFDPADVTWAEPTMAREFGDRLQARRGEIVDVLALPGFVATRAAEPIGILTYQIDGEECELAFLLALERHAGVGSLLVDALLRRAAGCTRVWVATTNDNLDALRFYQRRGFRLAALRAGAVDATRRSLKPTISTTGDYGIPLHDELDLELDLTG